MKTLQVWSMLTIERVGKWLTAIWVISAFLIVIGEAVQPALQMSKNVYYPVVLGLFLITGVGLAILGNEDKRRDKQHPWTAQRCH